jgi:hypothetical protein
MAAACASSHIGAPPAAAGIALHLRAATFAVQGAATSARDAAALISGQGRLVDGGELGGLQKGDRAAVFKIEYAVFM